MAELFNLASYFVDRHLVEGRGGWTAIVCEARRYTYAEIAALVNRAGNAFARAGVQPGDRVLIVVADGPEFVAAYFGAIKIGAVAVPTSTALRPADYAYLIEESQAKLVVGEEGISGLESCGAELECAPTSADDVAFWLWTSGSTGSPKAAVHRQRDWLCCCEGYASGVLDVRPGDVTFSSSKLFHAYGLGNGLMFPFYVGASTVLYPGKPMARTILEHASESRATLFFSVPTHFAAMLRETEAANPYDLSSVRLAVSAAEPLPEEIVRRWRDRFGFEVLDGIGSTEMLHIYISNRPRMRAAWQLGGAPCQATKLRIADEQGRDLQPGRGGRPLGARRQYRGALLESARAHGGTDARGLVLQRRQVSRRCGRVLLVRGPIRRYVPRIG